MAGRTSFASALLTGCCTWMISRAVLPAQRAAVSGGQRAAVRARPAPALRSRSVRPAAWAPRASGPALRRPLRAQPEGAEGAESAPPADEAPPVEAAAAPEAPPPTPAPAARAKDAEDEMDVSDVEWTSDADWAASEGYSRDGMDVAASDEGLRTHAGHLQYRWAKFVQRRRELEKYEGGLEEFSMGYRKYGFNREGNATVYREWAPAAAAASLIGDFNGWNPGSHVMERDQFGTWTVRVPDKEDGSPGIAHGSRVKIQLQRGDGWRVDRIPAWIKYATVEAGRLGALYDGVYWDPPAPYEWRHEAPPRPRAPRIYEAHVGMSAAEPACSTYRAFADDVLPRVAAGGYNTVQLMAVQEHAYYASFGYHVTNFFGVSSRSGNPDDLKYLVDTAHGLGLRVLLDIVHSHASSNADDGLNGFDFGQESSGSYFHSGARGYHTQWDSRCFRYDNWEVQRFLLSNVRYWMTEYKFDGFRFDGVTSMLYTHHGINRSFSGNYSEYFGTETDVDAVVYLMLANDLAHRVNPEATVLAEDVSGMPTLCRPVTEGGIGFDGRLAMAVPDHWIKLLKEKPDEAWNMHELVCTLCNRRYSERSIAYAESHDQALVGDKTIAFWLMDRAMYDGMSTTQPASPVVARGVALHKVIRGITAALGGEGYLNFMGNEFGHPEWIDFPRAGNGWSYQHCRRQWQLADADHLRYGQLGAFDRALMELEQKHGWLSHAHQMVSVANDYDKTIVAERGDLLWVFNFHTHATYSDYAVPAPAPGVWRCVLDSDAPEFGGNASAGAAECVATAGGPDSWVGPYKQEPRAATLKVRSVSRSVQAYLKVGDAPAAPAPPPAAAAAAAADPAPAEAAAPAPADAPADAPEPVAADAPPAAE